VLASSPVGLALVCWRYGSWLQLLASLLQVGLAPASFKPVAYPMRFTMLFLQALHLSFVLVVSGFHGLFGLQHCIIRLAAPACAHAWLLGCLVASAATAMPQSVSVVLG
jgi:hypothetical protein